MVPAGHRAGCRLSASAIYLSIYCLYLERLSLHVATCELRFLQRVKLSLFLSLSTVHCYTLRTSPLVEAPSPYPHWAIPSPSVRKSFMDDPYRLVSCVNTAEHFSSEVNLCAKFIELSFDLLSVCWLQVTTITRFRFNCRLTPILLQFDRTTTF